MKTTQAPWARFLAQLPATLREQFMIHHPGLAGAKPVIHERLARWIDLSTQGTLSLVVPTLGQPVDRVYHVATTRVHQDRGQLGCVVGVRQLGLRMGKDCPLPAEVVESF